jgi:multidrug efflux pump subunit AcrA (membrane-fusion protein)
MNTPKKVFNFTVTVYLASGTFKASWPARFERLREKVDPVTRAIYVVAVVDSPYDKAIPGVRPLLVKGMSCRMELKASASPHTTVVPACALEDGHVFVLSDTNRLQRRNVEVDFFSRDMVIIKSGLEPGEQLVVSGTSFAIEGMAVSPVIDKVLEDSIQHLSGSVREAQK